MAKMFSRNKVPLAFCLVLLVALPVATVLVLNAVSSPKNAPLNVASPAATLNPAMLPSISAPPPLPSQQITNSPETLPEPEPAGVVPSLVENSSAMAEPNHAPSATLETPHAMIACQQALDSALMPSPQLTTDSAVEATDFPTSNPTPLHPSLTPAPSTEPTPTAEPHQQETVCIVFDDGIKNQFTTAVPILQKYGFRATFAVITSFAQANRTSYMNWTNIKTLQNMGMDIESHSYSHRQLSTLDQANIEQEVAYSKQMLYDHGIDSNIFVYPFGDGPSSPAVREVVEQNYRWARGTYPTGVNITSDDPYALGAKQIYGTTSLSDFASKLNSTKPIVILFYHNIDDYHVTASQFDAEMLYLRENNFNVETLKEALTITLPPEANPYLPGAG